MTILVTASKGGQGATVVSIATALAGSRRTAPTPDAGVTLIDLTGDATAALGGLHDDEPGVADWLRSSASADRLDDLRRTVCGVSLLPWSPRTDELDRAPGVRSTDIDPSRWRTLGAAIRHHDERAGHTSVIDAGPATDAVRAAIDDVVVVTVTRACYLALRHPHPEHRPDAVVLVTEPGRALGPADVARSIGAPVIATTRWDPAIARAIDAGLDATGCPRPMRRLGGAVLAWHETVSGRRTAA
ncbi:MAG: hypothetical protein AAGG08_02570 [Actinomycetota bacterium]